MANDSLAIQAMSAPFRMAAAGGRLWWSGVRGMFNMGLDGARKVGDLATRAGRAGREGAETAASEIRSTAEEWGERLEDQVEAALNRLGVPGREDLDDLNRRVEELAARLGVDAPTSAASRVTYHVTPLEGQWQVKQEGAEEPSGSYETKAEALSAARELAHAREPSQLVVHRLDGTIQTSFSYGETG